MRKLTRLYLLLIPCLLFWTAASGAEYPAKTIQIISNFPPGSNTDIVARILQKKLSTLSGQSVVIINKAGGAGTVGIQTVFVSPADGYTILSSAPVVVIGPLTVKGLPFTFKDFVPISLSVEMPSVLSVKKDAPWKSLEELVADAKKNPGRLTYSSPGPATVPHLAGELFKMATGTDITHIPMDGAPKSMTAVLGGHVDIDFIAYGAQKKFLEAGSLRGLATMSRSPLEEFPDIPTTVKKGYPKLLSSAWVAFFVTAKTPPGIVRKLGEIFKEALNDKEIIGLLKDAGFKTENLGPEEASKFFVEESERLSQAIKAAKIGQ